MKRDIILSEDVAVVGPLSPAVKVGNLPFISGQVPRNDRGEFVGTTIQMQTKAVMDNVGKILKKQVAPSMIW